MKGLNNLGEHFNKAFLEREERGIWQLLGPPSLKKILKGVLPEFGILHIYPPYWDFDDEEKDLIDFTHCFQDEENT